MSAKTTTGNFFEDFQVGPVLHDLLVFHLGFGRAVPDVSLNSPANLGYADVRFLNTVYPGDTLRAETEVIGKRETSRKDGGIVWVRTRGSNQRDEPVLQFYRWAMVNKRDPGTSSGADDAPELPPRVAVEDLHVPPELDLSRFDPGSTGGRFLPVTHAISHDGLENVVRVLGFNAGTHANPTVAGDTLFAWTDVLERIDLGRGGAGGPGPRGGGGENPGPPPEAGRGKG